MAKFKLENKIKGFRLLTRKPLEFVQDVSRVIEQIEMVAINNHPREIRLVNSSQLPEPYNFGKTAYYVYVREESRRK